MPDDFPHSAKKAKLWNCNTETKICSGYILVFRTDDPEKRPLPSFDLLNMQWALHRALAMSGAADVNLEDLEDGEDYLTEQELSEEEESDEESYPLQFEMDIYSNRGETKQASVENSAPLARRARHMNVH